MVNLGGTQKVDFLGTCFGGAGLGLNSWASASLPKHCAPAFSAHDHYTEQFSVACIRGHTWATPSLAEATQ